MNRLLVRRAAELWLELANIRKQMTQEEKIWFSDFIKAYHMGNFAVLKKLCGDNHELYFEMKSEITYMRDIGKRCVPNPNRKRKRYGGDYSHVDYVIEGTANPEDTLIDVIDSFNNAVQEFI